VGFKLQTLHQIISLVFFNAVDEFKPSKVLGHNLLYCTRPIN